MGIHGLDFSFSDFEEDFKYFQNEYCKMEIKDNILYCVFAPFLNITLDVARVLVEDRIDFARGVSYPTLINISNLKYINKPAREYLASESGIKNISAAAYVASTQNELFLWEMFLKLNRPAYESKIFSTTLDAKEWLQQFK